MEKLNKGERTLPGAAGAIALLGLGCLAGCDMAVAKAQAVQAVAVRGPTVTVASSSTAPVIFRDVNEPTSQPFAAGLDRSNPCLTVPSGKRLVIQHLFGSAATNLDFAMNVGLFVTTQGTLIEHPTSFEKQGPILGTFWFSLSTPTTLYADPGSSVCANFASGSFLLSFRVSLSGYLVDVPPPVETVP